MMQEREKNLAVMEDYKMALVDLNLNSKPLITMLTMLADENKEFAADVVEVITNHAANTTHKLPLMYLIDSIVKNIKQDYSRLIAANIVVIFSQAFESVDEVTRRKLHELRQTWSDVFPQSRLYHLDSTVKAIDPAWPVIITKQAGLNASNIHLNPKFPVSPDPNSSPSTSNLGTVPGSSKDKATPSKQIPSGENSPPAVYTQKTIGKPASSNTQKIKKKSKITNVPIISQENQVTQKAENPSLISPKNKDRLLKSDKKNNNNNPKQNGDNSNRDPRLARKLGPSDPRRAHPAMKSKLPTAGPNIVSNLPISFPSDIKKTLKQRDVMKHRIPKKDSTNILSPAPTNPDRLAVKSPKNRMKDSRSQTINHIQIASQTRTTKPQSPAVIPTGPLKVNPQINSTHPEKKKGKFQIPKKRTFKEYQEGKARQSVAPGKLTVKEKSLGLVADVHNVVNNTTLTNTINTDSTLEPPQKRVRLDESPSPFNTLLHSSEAGSTTKKSDLPILFGSEDIDLRSAQVSPALTNPPPFTEPPITVSPGLGPKDKDLRRAPAADLPGPFAGSKSRSHQAEPNPVAPPRRPSFNSPNSSSWKSFRDQNPEFREYQKQASTERGPIQKELWVAGDGKKHFLPSNPPEQSEYGHPDAYARDQGWENRPRDQENDFSHGRRGRGRQDRWRRPEERNLRMGRKAGHANRPQPYERPDKPPIESNVPDVNPADVEAVTKLSVTRTIMIDEIPREIRNYGEKSVILMADDNPHLISFQSCSCDVVIDDGAFVFHLSVGDPYTQVNINGQSHHIKLGMPTQELFIDGVSYQCFFGGDPIYVDFDGHSRSVCLVGPSPQVDIHVQKNIDYLAGKIPLIINAEGALPLYLDPKPQKFSIGNKCLIIKFMDRLRYVKVNGVKFPVEFGGKPLYVHSRGWQTHLRFGNLPRGIVQGQVNIIGMDEEGRDLFPKYPVDCPTEKLVTPPVVVVDEQRAKSPMQSAIDVGQVANIFNVSTSNALSTGNGAIPGFTTTAGIDTLPVTSALDPSVDLRSLLNSLVQKGLISGSNEDSQDNTDLSKSNEASDDEDYIGEATRDVHTMFGLENLRKSYPSVIRQMYKGMQCSSCGMRFPSETGSAYSKHLDWHFRLNTRQQEAARKASSRQLYMSADAWYQYEEVEDDNHKVPSVFESEGGAAFGNDPVEEEEIERPTVGATRDDEDFLKSCPQCYEKFDQMYSDEDEGYRYKNAIQVEGINYHPDCHTDYLKQLERIKQAEIQKKVAQEIREAEILREKEAQLLKFKEIEIQKEKELEILREKEAQLLRDKEEEEAKQKKAKEDELQKERDAEEAKIREIREAELLKEREAEIEQEKEIERLKQQQADKEREATLVKEKEATLEKEKEMELLKEREADLAKEREVQLSQEKETETELQNIEDQKAAKEAERVEQQAKETQRIGELLKQIGHDHLKDVKLEADVGIESQVITEVPSVSSEVDLDISQNSCPSTEAPVLPVQLPSILANLVSLLAPKPNIVPVIPQEKPTNVIEPVKIKTEPVEVDDEVEMYVPPDFQIPSNLRVKEETIDEPEDINEEIPIEPLEVNEEIRTEPLEVDGEIEVIPETDPVEEEPVPDKEINLEEPAPEPINTTSYYRKPEIHDPAVPLQLPTPVIKINLSKSLNINPPSKSIVKVSNGVPDKIPEPEVAFVAPPFTFDEKTHPQFQGVHLKQFPTVQKAIEESSLCSIM